ncbi:origin recognition complex subunit 4 [Diplogelasinospora grovesii]|uniref:Origin recognition complex subunit 4 n=1 Tax=Diplogelasinospora grovesii TaxID=303347 RepID=A0AAN6S8P7_9PEZI|nr:origin recognition complex subunit 4 [Diplogelasinospora grovesii]
MSSPRPERKRRRSQKAEEALQSASILTKKRRLNEEEADATTSSSAPKTDNIISSAINGAINLGRRIASTTRISKPKAEHSNEAADSENEPEQPKKRQLAKKKSAQVVARDDASSIYDFPDSGDELRTTTTAKVVRQKSTVGVTKPTTATSAATKAVEGETPKKKRGRPRKVDQEAAKARDNENVTSETTPTKPRSAKRLNNVHVEEESTGLEQETEEEQTTALKRVQSGRGRKKILDLGKPPALKGILSPQKKDRVIGRRKSVAFDSDRDNSQQEEIYFEDLPTEPVKPTPKPAKTPGRRKIAAPEKETEDAVEAEPEEAEQEDEADSEAEEEDGEVCTVCNKPDSKRGNQILFCDKCDMAVHQKCYGIAHVPRGDWFCRNCSKVATAGGDDQEMTDAAPLPAVVAQQDETPDIPNFEQHLRSMQRVLLDRCTGRRRIKLRGQDEAYEKTLQLVEQTVAAGEGNSMLVIGARGCGKTTLVESVVDEMSERHKGQFHVVRLNGFIHTDDKLALKEIWRQLGKEMEVEDELVNKTNNYADTLASLLALLSHPSEIADAPDGLTSRSVIFIIDEFDLFATHARQTLLYNLFDIAQARKAPIAVLGLTTRIDVVESLEKRVKSRFSHRYVYLSLPKSLPAFWDLCKQGLAVDDEDMGSEGIDVAVKGHQKFWDWWNEKLEALYKTRGFKDHLESHFYSTKSVSAFFTTCVLPLSALSPTNLSPKIPTSTTKLDISLEPADSKLHLLESLSDLDLSMLIAAARLDIVAHTDTVNFAMAYDEYTSLMGRQRVQSASSGMLALGGGTRVWGRGVAGIAWERLVTLGLLLPWAFGGRGAGTQRGGGLDAKMWKVDVALEEIAGAVKLNAVLARWCREI